MAYKAGLVKPKLIKLVPMAMNLKRSKQGERPSSSSAKQSPE
jgi:hypothetical protein